MFISFMRSSFAISFISERRDMDPHCYAVCIRVCCGPATHAVRRIRACDSCLHSCMRLRGKTLQPRRHCRHNSAFSTVNI
jgi:hypothetical protein